MAFEFKNLGDTTDTTEPKLEVVPSLSPGTYTFQLEVTDDEGTVSAPDTVIVTVIRGQPRGKRPPIAKILVNKPRPLAGASFTLTGFGSFDPDGGLIRKYKWTLVDAQVEGPD